MYVCGSTVYQRVHVGNSRPFVLGMWLRSWLRETGYEVTLVHNITDVEDKVYAEAARLGIGSRELSARATEWFFEDTNDLSLGRPDLEPRATETIPEIVAFIGELVERGRAYEAGGDVYFSVAEAPEYGRLSGARLEDMVSQESSALKRDQRDFALWKSQKPHEDAAWDSPWGPGRPGWHIECSAMVRKHLGPEFEIHGGGLDLRFPHHENELAQSSALGHRFAHVWMHNGMLELDAEKMSKSLGNVVTLRNVLDTWGREALLVFHLTGHWSKPVDFSDEAMESAGARAEGFREVFRNPSEPAPADAWERSQLRSMTTSIRRRRSRAPRVARSRAADRRWHLRAQSLARTDEAPPRSSRSASNGLRPEARDFDESDRLRAEIEAAGWDVRDGRRFRLVRADDADASSSTDGTPRASCTAGRGRFSRPGSRSVLPPRSPGSTQARARR
jgi:cysteinyl-tRNA synthetase